MPMGNIQKMKTIKCIRVIATFAALWVIQANAQNPLIMDQFTADPSARVFGNRVYVYPSHDILATATRGRLGWFCMEDYHVFSSEDLTNWTDHGVIVTQNKVAWVKPDSYSMWAPDCIYRNGKYYFYFPTTPKDTTKGKGFTIGVAVGDKPEGPFVPQPEPIKNVRGIDPNVFIDKDGQAYLYWSAGNIYGAKLHENMLELTSEVVTLQELPSKGLKEGPFMFERNGKYYLTYPHVENKIERLEYAIGDNPLGPFKITGTIMDESPTGCWTNHHSIIPFKNQWYLFYHHNDLSPNFDKARSIRADSLSFNEDGTIRKVTPTLRGIGVSKANSTIQPDRYSAISSYGAGIDFLDTTNRFLGWKTILEQPGAWVQYNTVEFSKTPEKKVEIKAFTTTGATLVIRTKDPAGTVIAEFTLPKGQDWRNYKYPVKGVKGGLQNLVLQIKGPGKVEVDWVRFE
jgi:Glycosyl hydrolases family 43/Carbohydrate binding module (family 6)